MKYLSHEDRAVLQPMYDAVRKRDWTAAHNAAKTSDLGWVALVYYSVARMVEDMRLGRGE